MGGILLRSIGALAALLMMSGAWGASITWTLNNVTFDDGATAAGTFDYDATANFYSNINISVTGFVIQGEYGSLDDTDPYTYIPDTISDTDDSLLAFDDLDFTSAADDCDAEICIRFTNMTFSSPLTGAGGFIPLQIGDGSLEVMTKLGGSDLDVHSIVSGSVSAAAVLIPIPAAVYLFGSALGLLGWSRRKAA